MRRVDEIIIEALLEIKEKIALSNTLDDPLVDVAYMSRQMGVSTQVFHNKYLPELAPKVVRDGKKHMILRSDFLIWRAKHIQQLRQAPAHQQAPSINLITQ